MGKEKKEKKGEKKEKKSNLLYREKMTLVFF
jgi:hypothetical protein